MRGLTPNANPQLNETDARENVHLRGAVLSVNGRTGAVTLVPEDIGAEGTLGNPSSDGFVLSSTAAGVRSWVSASLASLPSQTGNSGKFLGTNGTGAAWNSIAQSDVSGLSTALGAKAPLASPTFTGTVTIPSGAALGTPASLTLTNATGLPQSGVTNLVSDLAAKAPIASPTFTGTVTIPSGAALGTPASLTLTNASSLPLSGVTNLTSSLAAKLAISSNLSDLASVSTARTNLGLGTAAVVNTGTSGANVPLLSTANTWTLAQTGPFSDKGGTVYNVKAYGVTGDGSTDDITALNTLPVSSAGGTIYFPSGTYVISDTWNLQNKSNLRILCDRNALISPKSTGTWTNKSVVSLAGSSNVIFDGVHIRSGLTTNQPLCGLLLGRTIDAGNGGGNAFRSCVFEGKYTGATVYNVGAENVNFLDCQLQTETLLPAYYDSSDDTLGAGVQTGQSNTRKQFYSCVFKSTATNGPSSVAKLIQINEFLKEISFDHCYAYLTPTPGIVIDVTGSGSNSLVTGIFLNDMRVEGVGASYSRLLKVENRFGVAQVRLSGLNWAVAQAVGPQTDPDYLIEATGSSVVVDSSDIEARARGFAVKFIHLTGSAQMTRSRIVHRDSATLVADSGSSFNTCRAEWITDDNPFSGAGTYSQVQVLHPSWTTLGRVTANPSALVEGAVWYRGDLHDLRFYNGSSTLSVIASSTGRVTNAQLPLGAALYDNAGTPKLSGNFDARIFYGFDGTTEALNFSDAAGEGVVVNGHLFAADGGYSSSSGQLDWGPDGGIDSGGSLNLLGTGGASYLHISNQSAAPSTPSSAGRIYFDASNLATWKGTDGVVHKFINDTDTGTVTDKMLATAVKPAVAVVATANLTLSGEQTIDGQLTSGSLVLTTAQTTGSQNGPWVSASGAWARPTWYTNGSTTQAPQFLTTFVRLGTTYQGSMWRMTTASVTIGTTATTWVQTPIALGSTSVIGTLGVTNGGNGLATATLGDLRYGSGTNTLAALAGNITTTKKSLVQTGNGSVSAAPSWSQLASTDLSDTASITLQGNTFNGNSQLVQTDSNGKLLATIPRQGSFAGTNSGSFWIANTDNSTAQQTLATWTPSTSGVLNVAERNFHVHIAGTETIATTTTVTFRFTIGGTAIIAFGPSSSLTAATRFWSWDFDFTIVSTGSSGTVIAHGIGVQSGQGVNIDAIQNPVTVDLTGTPQLAVTVQFGSNATGAGNNTCKQHHMAVYPTN